MAGVKLETLEELRDALDAALELLGHRRFESKEYNDVRAAFEHERTKVEREIEEATQPKRRKH